MDITTLVSTKNRPQQLYAKPDQGPNVVTMQPKQPNPGQTQKPNKKSTPFLWTNYSKHRQPRASKSMQKGANQVQTEFATAALVNKFQKENCFLEHGYETYIPQSLVTSSRSAKS